MSVWVSQEREGGTEVDRARHESKTTIIHPPSPVLHLLNTPTTHNIHTHKHTQRNACTSLRGASSETARQKQTGWLQATEYDRAPT